MKILFLANSTHIKPTIVLKKLFESEWINTVQFSVVTNGSNGSLESIIDKNNIKSFIIETTEDLKCIIQLEKADYLICCGWNSLLPNDIIKLPNKVSLNCHSSYLPDYKGASVFKHYWSNWENQTGATVHVMDKEFDNGNIVAQRKLSLKWYYTPKTIITSDSEVVVLTNQFVSKMADIVVTQHCYEKNIGKKHHKLNTFFESCYLHPDYFNPDENLLKRHGINPGEKYSVLRFVGWEANHDIGMSGISDKKKIELVKKLEEFGKVIITSEKKLPEQLSANAFNAPPNAIHHLLYYASLYFGDSQSMATEASLLGTPSIRCNQFVGENDMSYFKYLENELTLLYNFKDIDIACKKAINLISQEKTKTEWQIKREAYFSDLKDPNKILFEFVQKSLSE